MKKLLLIICLASINCFSQDLKDKVNKNVIYIYFEKEDPYQKKTVSLKTSGKEMDRSSYIFSFIEENNKSLNKEVIKLEYSEYADYDEMSNDNRVLLIEINKSFLKKNKNLILTRKIMHKIGFIETRKIIERTKKILLIENNNYNNKITIRVVKYYTMIE